jgi:hypothetical protein
MTVRPADATDPVTTLERAQRLKPADRLLDSEVVAGQMPERHSICAVLAAPAEGGGLVYPADRAMRDQSGGRRGLSR